MEKQERANAELRQKQAEQEGQLQAKDVVKSSTTPESRKNRDKYMEQLMEYQFHED